MNRYRCFKEVPGNVGDCSPEDTPGEVPSCGQIALSLEVMKYLATEILKRAPEMPDGRDVDIVKEIGFVRYKAEIKVQLPNTYKPPQCIVAPLPLLSALTPQHFQPTTSSSGST